VKRKLQKGTTQSEGNNMIFMKAKIWYGLNQCWITTATLNGIHSMIYVQCRSISYGLCKL